MSILTTLRDRFSSEEPASQKSENSPNGGGLSFSAYDRLGSKQVMEKLRTHTQVELEAIETHEREHQSRQDVLNKLRFMRTREPLPGYDDLSVDEVLAALGSADMPSVKRVRDYERKFAQRPPILDHITAAQRAEGTSARG